MQKRYRPISTLPIICALLALALCFHCSSVNTKGEENISPSLPTLDAPAISAQSAILIDASSGLVLCEKNAYERMAMASTTKIMTALVVCENTDLDNIVSVAPEAVGVEGSSIYLYAGERLSVRDLLAALLLESANDAAAALAIYVSGSIEDFCVLMNEKARELGLEDTHFTNPHGLYDEEHYTTAYDLAKISARALENETVREIVSTKKLTVTPTEGNVRVLRNHNKMLSYYDGAIGVKTGFTKKSGRCLVSAAERDGLRLVAVTLNAPDDWKDHTALLDLGFENFCSVELVKKGEVCHILPVMGGKEQYCELIASETVSVTLKKSDANGLCQEVGAMHRYEFAPIEYGSVKGQISFYIENKKIAVCNLVAAQDIARAEDKGSMLYKIKNIFNKTKD